MNIAIIMVIMMGWKESFEVFALVIQKDTEEFEHYVKNTEQAGAVNTTEESLYQPAVITKTWFHTGAFLRREKIFHQMEEEYYPHSLIQDGFIDDPQVINTLESHILPEAPVPPGLTTPELIECLRALKGLPLRQEVYSDEGEPELQIHPYTVTQYNYDVQLLQPKGEQQHAVFFPLERENLAFHYERNPLDPRIAHKINLDIDEYGNVRQSASVVYGRLDEDITLPTLEDRTQQTQRHVIFTENNFTNSIDDETGYRLPALCETLSWELGVENPANTFYQLTELVNAFDNAEVIQYFQTTQDDQKRLIEHIRTTFLSNDLAQLLPLGQIQSLALPGQSYQLAMTPELADHLYGNKVDDNLLRNTGRYVQSEVDGNYWISSGRIYFHPDLSGDPFTTTINPPTNLDVDFTRSNFYLPVVYEDNYGYLSKVFYDSHRLFVERIIDALENETLIEQFHYRTLIPWLIRDINHNRSGVRFDELGLVTQTFVMGKSNEQLGDLLDVASFENSLSDDPTTRLTYEFRYYDSEGELPNRVISQARERHRFQPMETDSGDWITEENPAPVWQTSFSYSDGSGNVVLQKVQAEPGEAPARDNSGNLIISNGIVQMADTNLELRWTGNGRTIFNNKGNPVKQYEPFFDSSPEYNREDELVLLGFTPILYYDALGRLIRTENPNGTFSRVAFDAWQQQTWDENDTVIESTWYSNRINGQLGALEEDAAQKAEIHYDTPSSVYLDSLGRPFLSIAHNRAQGSNGVLTEEFYHTRTHYDIESNPHTVIDARGNQVMAWHYDMLGNVCRQESMDAGTRWNLNDVMGKPIHSWDSRQHLFSYTYDRLHRPLASRVNDGSQTITFGQIQYGDGPGFSTGDPIDINLRGQPWRIFDTAGLVENLAFDFKGNLLGSNRTLLQDYQNAPDWTASPSLEDEQFATSSNVDALNRPIRSTSPDGSIFLPVYNEANLLNRVGVRIRGVAEITDIVHNIDYNAKGQRERIHYANETTTRYTYEPETYRLNRLLTTTRNPQNQEQFLQDLNYTYDPVGNITQIFDNAQKTIFFGGQRIQALSEYWYDALYRLIDATGREHIGQFNPCRPDDNWDDSWCRIALQPNSPIQLRNYRQRYEYDSVGNIMQMQHGANGGSWTRTYQYRPGNNQLTSTTIDPNGCSRNHTYDYNEHGSMISLPHLFQMDWNFKEELYHVNLLGGGQAWYVYDGSGQRTRKVIQRQNGRIEERIYLGGFEIYRERRGNVIELERETLHVMNDSQRIVMIESRTRGDDGSPQELIRYQYGNHLGSASLELDEEGAVIGYEEYHPYGTTAYQAVNANIRAVAKRYRYTGMERDEETGMNYHGARHLIIWLGEWIQPDPMGLIDGVNTYRYSKNNPILFLDSKGTHCDSSIRSCLDDPNYESTLREEADQMTLPEEERHLPATSFASEPEHTSITESGGVSLRKALSTPSTSIIKEALELSEKLNEPPLPAQLAIEATEYYAELAVEGEGEGGVSGFFKQGWGYIGGTIAVLATPELAPTTAITLGTAGIGAVGSAPIRASLAVVGSYETGVSSVEVVTGQSSGIHIGNLLTGNIDIGRPLSTQERTISGITAVTGGLTLGYGAYAQSRTLVTTVEPQNLRWSQTTAGGRGGVRAQRLRASMAARGYDGPPIDTVQTAEGVLTIDNTRPAVALELGISEIPATVHHPDSTLPLGMIFPRSRFGGASTTWGGAAATRTSRQTPPLPPSGRTKPPRIPSRKK